MVSQYMHVVVKVTGVVVKATGEHPIALDCQDGVRSAVVSMKEGVPSGHGKPYTACLPSFLSFGLACLLACLLEMAS